LKRELANVYMPHLEVAPRRGAWIETTMAGSILR